MSLYLYFSLPVSYGRDKVQRFWTLTYLTIYHFKCPELLTVVLFFSAFFWISLSHAAVNCGPVASWWSFTNIVRCRRACLCTSGFTQAAWKWLASVTSPKLLLFVSMEYSGSVMWACHEYSDDGVLVWLIHYRLWQPHPSGRATLWPSFGKPLERTDRLALWEIM